MSDYVTTLDHRITKAVAYFSVYSDEIESVVFKSDQNNERDINKDIVPGILNGETTLALQRLVPINVRKEAGIFFTSTMLSDKVADHLAPMFRTGVKLIDPACGAGNLLLACAKYLPSVVIFKILSKSGLTTSLDMISIMSLFEQLNFVSLS